MLIREAKEQDIQEWAKMRSVLWPETAAEHILELQLYFSGNSIDIIQAYVAELDSSIIGFMELNIRNFAEGSRNSKVPYVEAWYIENAFQGRGYGKLLMQRAEAWAETMGYAELASDTDINNASSIAMHQQLGFTEVERVVCFLKRF